MGCLTSKVAPVLDIFKRSIAIDALLAEESRIQDEKIKLLFLGTDDFGKRTVFDKMDHGHRYTKDERIDLVYRIHTTIIRTIKQLAQHVQGTEIDATEEYKLIMGTDESEVITAPIGSAINVLWDHPIIKDAWSQRSALQVNDAVAYWFTVIDKVKKPNYTPDKEDILAAQAQFNNSSGVKVGRRVIENTTFEMYDIVRQRGKLRKWIHCFENVITAIIYVVDISAYDQMRITGKHSKNVVMESLEKFEELLNDQLYFECPVILLLNNREDFEHKVRRKNIRDCGFVDYEGREWDSDAGLRYFMEKFKSKNYSGKDRQVHTLVTSPSDMHITKALYGICKEVVLRQDIQQQTFGLD